MLEDSQVGKKLSGIFKGKVISHLPCGRCKIFIPDVYPEEWLKTSTELKDIYGQDLNGAKLPDAEQATPLFGGSSSGNGMFSYPKIDSYVWCMFERNDINHPVYFAAVIDLMDMGKSNSFSLCTINSENGSNLKHIIACGKSSIVLDESGKIEVKTGNASISIVGGTIEIRGKTVNMNSSGNIEINGINGLSIEGLNLDLKADVRMTSESPLYQVTAPFSCRINDKEFAG